jgi:hypothetical protein
MQHAARQFLITVATTAALVSPAFADELSNLCTVPVKQGVPTKADRGRVDLMADTVRMLPGVPRPIIYSRLRHDGAWTVSQDDAFVPLGGSFPQDFFDKFALEPDTGRVIGKGGLGLYVLEPGETQFRQLLATRDSPLRDIRDVTYVPRLRAVVISAVNGLYRLRGDLIEPFPDAGKDNTGDVSRIFDLPGHNALVLQMVGGGLLVRYDNGQVIELYKFERSNYALAVHEMSDTGRLLIESSREQLEVTFPTESETLRQPRVRVLWSRDGSTSLPKQFSRATNRYVVLGRPAGPFGLLGKHGLEYLGRSGLEAVPGGDFPQRRYVPIMRDLPTRGVVLIPGEDRLYVYDGNKVIPVPHSSTGEIGDKVRIDELPSIDKVLLTTDRGVFEFTAERSVVPIALPFAATLGDFLTYAEMPASHTGLIFSTRGLFGIDRAGTVQRIPGTDGGYGLGLIPVRNVFLAATNSLYLVKDKRLSPEGCTASN